MGYKIKHLLVYSVLEPLYLIFINGKNDNFRHIDHQNIIAHQSALTKQLRGSFANHYRENANKMAHYTVSVQIKSKLVIIALSAIPLMKFVVQR